MSLTATATPAVLPRPSSSPPVRESGLRATACPTAKGPVRSIVGATRSTTCALSGLSATQPTTTAVSLPGACGPGSSATIGSEIARPHQAVVRRHLVQRRRLRSPSVRSTQICVLSHCGLPEDSRADDRRQPPFRRLRHASGPDHPAPDIPTLKAHTRGRPLTRLTGLPSYDISVSPVDLSHRSPHPPIFSDLDRSR